MDGEESQGRETTDMLVIEEAHGLLANDAIRKLLFDKLRTAGKLGFSIWVSTHRLSDVPAVRTGEQSQSILTELKNLIVHKVDESEDGAVRAMLLPDGDATQLPTFDITGLVQGQAVVSGPLGVNGKTGRLRPVLVKVSLSD